MRKKFPFPVILWIFLLVGISSATIDPLLRRSETIFDANGRATEAKDPLNRTTFQVWNARGEKDRATDALSKNTDFIYDNIGNLKTYTNRRGKSYLSTYDNANRLTTSTTPTGKVTTTTYFNNNQIKTLQEPSLQTTTFAYNARNLLASKIDPVATTIYLYDDSTLLKTITEGPATITRTYDERGRLKTFTTADGDLIQYRYDANNNLTRLTYPDGKQVNYTYNSRNALATVTDWSSRTTTYTYDRIGRLITITRPNGTTATFAHDVASQLLSIRESKGSKLFSYLSFQYDAAGQIKNRLQAPLLQSGFQHPTLTATYDDDNRLLTANGTAVTHDADGNMTSGPIQRGTGVSPASSALTYNSRNQLTTASGIGYTYDAEGRRRTFTDATGTTRDVIDPSGKLLVRNHPNGTKTCYVYGLGLLYEANQANQTKTYHFDQVGSTIARTDDSGLIIGRASYSAYGLTTYTEGDMATPFRYNGQAGVQTDPNGLLNMRARYYSPYLMRFLNADPIGFSGGSNWFAYADGNPISLNDPFGLCADTGGSLGTAQREFTHLFKSLPSPVQRFMKDGYDTAADMVNMTMQGALGPNPGMLFGTAAGASAQAVAVGRGAMATRGVMLADEVAVAAKTAPELGLKLEYFLGNASGNLHNVQRSTGMLRQLESVGLHDNPATRQYLTEHLGDVVNNASNLVRTQANGAAVRESLLMGPNGGMKFETVWDGAKLITGKLIGGN